MLGKSLFQTLERLQIYRGPFYCIRRLFVYTVDSFVSQSIPFNKREYSAPKKVTLLRRVDSRCNFTIKATKEYRLLLDNSSSRLTHIHTDNNGAHISNNLGCDHLLQIV